MIKALFAAFYYGYRMATDIFRIFQLFMQQGMTEELRPEVRKDLNDKGRINFEMGRRFLAKGMERGLIKKVNVHEIADVVWGTIVEVIQLEDIKSDEQKNHEMKEKTLRLAEKLIADAIIIENRRIEK